MRLFFVLVLVVCIQGSVHAACTGGSPTWTATNDNASVQTCVNNATAGDTVNVLSGTTTWTAAVTISKNLKIIGAGQGVTVVNGPNFSVSGVTASGSTVSVRISGFTFNMGTNELTLVDAVNFRLDHDDFNTTNSGTNCVFSYSDNGTLNSGLIDHSTSSYCQFEEWGGDAANDANTQNIAYSGALPIGTSRAIFFEDNTFTNLDPSTGSYFNCFDEINGGSYVIRFTTLDGCRVEAHGVQADNSRGNRSWEVYNSTIVNTHGINGYWPFSQRGGTGMVFHNTLDNNWINHLARIDSPRLNESSLADVGALSLWQFCDGTTKSTYTNATISSFSITGNVVTFVMTSVSGGGLSVGNVITPQNMTVGTYLNGQALTVVSVIGSSPQTGFTANFTHANVGSTPDSGYLYLTFASNKSLIVDAQGANGYRCRDQIGAGSDASTWAAGWNTTPPAQALAPVYFWKNPMGGSEMPVTLTCETTTDNLCTLEQANVQVNRDWYIYNASFTGASGIGEGTFAAMPATCTVGVGYWATDQGNWNQKLPANTSGQFYQCTSTNVWTLYYTPYTYPHPLQGFVAGGSGSVLAPGTACTGCKIQR